MKHVETHNLVILAQQSEITEVSEVPVLTASWKRPNQHLLLALGLAFVYHGSLLISGSFKRTYDAYIHIFFGDHYARAWFDHWDYRWYTGFTLTSYPPGSQQTIGLLSLFIGLINAFAVVQLCAILTVTVGIYRFSRIWVSEEAAGYAALLLVFSSCISETVHVFGQLPTTFSLGFLLNALPYVYRWLINGKIKFLIVAWMANAATTAGHHVTTLFGALFFVAPVIGLAIVQKFREPLPDEPPEHPALVSRQNLRPLVMRRLRRIIPVTLRSGIYGVGLVAALVLVVLPYWLWSKDDPISQVSIPHASRDSFIANPNAGIVFWLLPYGLSLIALPYAFYKGLSSRAWPMALSLGLLVLLGTGGTTPIPKLILRGSFDILTLDRFTFWASITVMPLLGEFVVSLRHRGLAKYFQEQFGRLFWRGLQITLLIAYLAVNVIAANFTQFRKFQPAAIDMQPIVNFLEKDQHSRWRYLTLGFGDQMAWLSAQTLATSVDGNYHSARRLPEMTTTSVERLEGAKYRGVPGIGSLQQFLAVPEKYNLKFIFSNDQFYDPLLYFSGWHKLQRLENGIMVWEREDIPPLPEILPRKEIPIYQRIMWGIVPITALVSAVIAMLAPLWSGPFLRLWHWLEIHHLGRFIPGRRLLRWLLKIVQRVWRWLDNKLLAWSQLPPGQSEQTGSERWQFWRGWVSRVKRLKPAPPSARRVRSVLVVLVVLGGLAAGGISFVRQFDNPVKVVESYYDDLDFRRYSDAYLRLDPVVRPSYEQYKLQLSVINGLVASYGKLDSVKVKMLSSEPEHAKIEVETVWITALAEYPTIQQHDLVKRGGHWYIVPDPEDVKTPPDQFFRQGQVAWGSQGRRQVTTGTTNFSDVLDRPEIQVLSARLVKENDRYSVVGELINTDVDPADLTVTAVLFDGQGEELTRYNAQSVLMHKILPKEVTAFRVTFEGVAGTVLSDTTKPLDFKPGDFTPPNVELNRLTTFDVYAKAVVTGRDLGRSVGLQNTRLEFNEKGDTVLRGELINTGTREATIPHILATYYNENNQVVWVDEFFIEQAVRPQRTQPFEIKLTPKNQITSVLDKGNLYSNLLSNGLSLNQIWQERLALPSGLGYASVRLSVHYFEGGGS